MAKFTSIPAAIAAATQSGKPTTFSLGGNLYLLAGPTGSASWLLRYRAPGSVVQLGLGSAIGLGGMKVSREQARARANKTMSAIIDGIDPRAEKRRAKLGDTFLSVFDRYLTDKVPAKSHAQWKQSMRDHASSLLKMRVADIAVDDVLAVLRPKWGTETASRVQDRISRVLSAAVTAGLVKENVGRWKDHLANVLTDKPAKSAKEGHAALPYADLPALVARLDACEGAGAQALLFCILTASRAGETLGALKSEIDREARVWSIPAARMKAGNDHFVPLSDKAMEIVNARWDLPGDHLFANAQGKPLGATALNDKLVKPANRGGFNLKGVATVHGFRATFSTWAQETTSIPAEIVEMCLAHTVSVDKSMNAAIRAAYARGKCVDKRTEAMNAWSNFCSGSNNVTLLRVAA